MESGEWVENGIVQLYWELWETQPQNNLNLNIILFHLLSLDAKKTIGVPQLPPG